MAKNENKHKGMEDQGDTIKWVSITGHAMDLSLKSGFLGMFLRLCVHKKFVNALTHSQVDVLQSKALKSSINLVKAVSPFELCWPKVHGTDTSSVWRCV